MLKKFVAVLICASIVTPAISASFGKSSGSRSSGSSSSVSRSSSGSSAGSSNSSPSRQSAGMSRSNVTESVRSGSYRNNGNNGNTGNASNNPGNNYQSPSYGNNGNQNNYGNNGNNYGNNQRYNNPQYNNPQYNSPSYGSAPNYNPGNPNRYGMGSVVGAGVAGLAAGALVGYMMHRDNSGNTYYTKPNEPNVAYDNQGNRMSSVPNGNYTQQGTVDVNGNVGNAGNMGNPANNASNNGSNNASNGFNNRESQVVNQKSPVAPEQKSSFWGIVGWMIFILLVIGAITLFMSRRKIGSSGSLLGRTSDVGAFIAPNTTRISPRTQLEDQADKIFMDIQKNNRPSQIEFIKKLVDPVFFDSIRDSVMAESEDKEVTVQSVESEVVDVSQKGSKTIASVAYRAVLIEKNGSNIEKQTLHDVWHFTYQDGKWLWSGLDEVTRQVDEDIDGNNDPQYKL